MNIGVCHHCPACRTDVYLGFRWPADEWRRYRDRLRTPICPGCARLLIVGPEDLELRIPTPVELFRAHVEIDDIEAVQLEILRQIKGRAWRVLP